MKFNLKTCLAKWPHCLLLVSIVALVIQCWPLVFPGELDFDRLYVQLERHEGKRYTTYNDMLGIPHIGIGFNLARPGAEQDLQRLGLDFAEVLSGRQSLGERQVWRLFKADVRKAVQDCHELFPNFSTLDDVRKRALVDMMFNLGKDKLKLFEKMIAAVTRNDFVAAADEMVDSKWYVQVRSRGPTIENMMRVGTDPFWLEAE